MTDNRTHMMEDFNSQLDDVRSVLYQLLEFDETDYSEKKNLVKREVLYGLNELRIKVENL